MNRTYVAIAATIVAAVAALSRPLAASQPRPETKWEYQVTESGPGVKTATTKWNEVGEKGWELVALHPHLANGTIESVYAVFKRPKQ